MAIATCVFTCRSWFCMSRITCLIIFSGSSALSIRSLRFARTNVETRSSNAINHLVMIREPQGASREFMESVAGSGLELAARHSLLRTPCAAYQRDRNVHHDAGGDPDSDVASSSPRGRAQRASEGNAQAQRS